MTSPDDTGVTYLSAARGVLAMALEPPNEEAVDPGTRFGDYELLEELGRGASGVVYRARHSGLHPMVALKLMKGADLATELELERFRDGADAAAALDHPNIVPVYHVGEHDGRPFFTMKLLAGGNLADALRRFPRSPEEAASLLIKIASAVQHAHDRALLHRDLKPANILLDEHGEPHLADFGVAAWLDRAASIGQSNKVPGAIDYMAPEQASGISTQLTVATDVYSLGVIFYELLTGEVPFPGATPGEVLKNLASDEPAPSPRKLNRSVSRDLETVCLKCLEKEPTRRYESARLLAHDLQLVLSGQPPGHARRVSALERAARWAVRRRWQSVPAALVAASALFLWFTVTRERDQAFRDNDFIATVQASAVYTQQQVYAGQVAQAAQDPAIRALLDGSSFVNDSQVLKSLLKGFDSAFVVSTTGDARAHWPTRTTYDLQSFAFRDYFRGAKKLAAQKRPEAYWARGIRSEADGRFKFGIAARILGDNGEWLGVLLAMLPADSTFGAVRVQDSSEGVRYTALLGPRDNERADRDAPLPQGLSFVVHPKLPRGDERTLGEPLTSTLRGALGLVSTPGDQFTFSDTKPYRVDHYVDPMFGSDREWIAAFAPVGKTGYVVVAQTPRDAALHTTVLAKMLVWWIMWLVAGIGLALIGKQVWFKLRRHKADKRAVEQARRFLKGQQRVEEQPSP